MITGATLRPSYLRAFGIPFAVTFLVSIALTRIQINTFNNALLILAPGIAATLMATAFAVVFTGDSQRAQTAKAKTKS